MKILLVDDDMGAAQAMLSILRGVGGHQVVSAASGEEALETAVALGGVDLLVSDVVMTPMDGFTLNDRLRALYPEVRTVFVSGYDLSDHAARIDSTPVLMKPVERETLLAVVESLVAAAGGATRQAAVPARPTVRAVATGSPTVRALSPGAQPRAVAVKPTAPSAPTAKPVSANAQPRAVAAQPSATKAPVATARAVPAPAVRAISAPASGAPVQPAQARAVPAPSAAPRAQPLAVQPAPAPRVVPAATARPVAFPAAGVAPGVSKPLQQPRALRPAVVAASAPPEGVPAQAPAIPPESGADLIGRLVGGYQIVSYLGQGRWGPVYAAVQTAINRPVGLKVLDLARAAEEEQKQRFIADARAKAHVQHPSILAVYEAGASEGWIFYTHEYVDGQNLAEMYASGRTIDEITALKIIRVAGEGLLYLSRNDIAHSALTAGDIYLGVDGHPRVANIATQYADQQFSVPEEIQLVGEAIWPVLKQPVSPGLTLLLGRTQQASETPINAWGALLQGAKALEPRIIPLEAEKISAQERAAAAAAEKARVAQRRSLYLNLVSILLMAGVALWAVWNFALRSNERNLDQQVHIPAGPFIFGEGHSQTVDEFWIDKYEVTIGQYAKFVEWIRANPGEEHSYDHQRQPKQLSHLPGNEGEWDIYYKQAERGGRAHGVPISLNSPVMMVTWWDAYAYARWKGRDLPTEQEWERAGRGTDGRAYPWGENPEVKRANTNADFVEAKPSEKGNVDGFNYWGDVDEQKSDKSPDGVIGMCGNVSEWTATWTADNTKPFMKGGNFAKPLLKLSERTPAAPGERQEYIGFRTVSHKAPEKS